MTEQHQLKIAIAVGPVGKIACIVDDQTPDETLREVKILSGIHQDDEGDAAILTVQIPAINIVPQAELKEVSILIGLSSSGSVASAIVATDESVNPNTKHLMMLEIAQALGAKRDEISFKWINAII